MRKGVNLGAKSEHLKVGGQNQAIGKRGEPKLHLSLSFI
jgi:hypothetical protein